MARRRSTERAGWSWLQVAQDAETTTQDLLAEIVAASDETLTEPRITGAVLGNGSEHTLTHLAPIACITNTSWRGLIRRTPRPSAPMVKTAVALPSCRTNASWRPFGDQTGNESLARPFETRLRARPSRLTVKICQSPSDCA